MPLASPTSLADRLALATAAEEAAQAAAALVSGVFRTRMTVVEKARQIALLKTLGASDLGIVVVFLIQGSVIGVIGGTLGVAIGLAVCFYLKIEGFPIPAEVYYIDRLPVQIDVATVGLVYLAALVISFAATIYPSVLGAQLRPAVGLKKS